MFLGTTSRIRCVPVVARPPAYHPKRRNELDAPSGLSGQLACSVRNDIGNASYNILNLPNHSSAPVTKPRPVMFEPTILALFIIGISKDPTIQQCTVYISHHGSDIPGRVWLAVFGIFDRFEV